MISPELRQRLETLQQNIVASSTANTLATYKAEVKLVKDQYSEAKVRGFTVIQAGLGEFRRNRQGPYSNGLFHRIRRLLRERHIRQKCKSRWTILRFARDNRDRVLGRKRALRDRQHRPYFKRITVETKISTKDPVERVIQVAQETHRRCPVHATLARATEITFKLVVNGKSVPIEISGLGAC
jgi:hypothetical protein